ncbi:MAG TPA: biotin--[acetyl-CoA-carboxylase] ligase [Clostridia bacterium]|nr:biotin--[acetyl-CoA-carboxylase] ligase [Clostridia bacterium]
MALFRFIEFDRLESTNTYAREHIRELCHGDVVQAQAQTAGRGRWQRRWVSDSPGNLYLTVVIKTGGAGQKPRPVSRLSSLSHLMAVAACKTVETFGIQPAIKWPNDVLVDGRKLAGILAESVIHGSEFLGMGLGIGLNLNMDPAALERIDQPATSMSSLLGREIDVREIRNGLLNHFFSQYQAFMEQGFPVIRDQYLSRVGFLGRAVIVRHPQGDLSGVARDISNEGGLMLELADGRAVEVTLGELGVS